MAENFWEEFKEILPSSRPWMRWWIPATVSEEAELVRELQMMKLAGFAGAEVVPMTTFNPELGRYEQGWGLERWSEILKVILREANALDFGIDLMILRSAPTALPLITDTCDPKQGVRLELDGAHVDGITKETPYEGALPINQEAITDASRVKGNVSLYAVTVAKYADKANGVLDFDSAKELDIASHVTKVGEDECSYNVRFAPEDAGEYVLFAWWKHPSGENAVGIPQQDLLGRYGTNRLIDYYENTFLPSLGEESKYINSFFIDSIEWSTHLDFVEDFRELFAEKYGYDLIKYLPALYEQNWHGLFREPKPDFSFDVNSEQLLQVYGAFLTELYIENHIKPMREFCERNGLTLRYQTSYGKYLELARTAMHVDIPDTETLYGKDVIDFYRVQSGAVHIGKKPIYSIEAAAEAPGRGNGDENSGNYEQGYKKLLWHLQRAYAGGVNRVYFHGCRYRGDYYGPKNEHGVMPNTHWPGYEPMGFVAGCANSWDERQPNWKGMRQLTDAIARMQTVLQKGKPQIDLAIYHHAYMETIDFCGAKRLFDSTSLEQLGYTYDFICSADLINEKACGDGKALYRDEPGYKALVFYRQRTLPIPLVRKLHELADRGIPIIFCEEIPKEAAFFGEGNIQEDLKALLLKKSVCVCECAESLPACLNKFDVMPDILFEATTDVLGVHRKTKEADYFYFYHYADADTYSELEGAQKIRFAVTLNCQGSAYILDPWTGTVKRAEPISISEDHLSVLLELAPNDSLMVVAERDSRKEIRTELEPKKRLLDNNSFEVKNWTLTLESWTAGDTPLETAKEIVRTVKQDRPAAWTLLDGCEDVSGVGYYRSCFDLKEGWEEGEGALLSVKSIEDCYALKVNGEEVPANQADATVDIGRYVRKGENLLEIEVYSTLLNAAITYGREHEIKPLSGKPQYKEYGMTGPVKIIPYKVAK